MSIKVCMFVYNNFLHDTRVLKEARSLIASGYDVTVLAALDKKSKPFGEREEQQGIKVIRVKIPIHYRIFCLISEFFLSFKKKQTKYALEGANPSHLPSTAVKNGDTKVAIRNEDRKLRAGRNVIRVFQQRFLGILTLFHKLFSFVDYYVRSYRVVTKHHADIYHANDLNTLPIAWWVARKHGAKLVYDSHELYMEKNMIRPPHRIIKFLIGRLEAFLIRRTNAVITVNESIADELSRRYHVSLPTVVMNAPSRTNGIVRSNVNLLREALNVRQDYRLLLYAGFITFNRGIEKMIQSLTYLPDCYLVFMGYGTEKYKKQLLKIILQSGLESRVAFYGPVPSDEVIRYAAGADLGVAPIENSCLSYYYCSPNKVFEYINAGLAVIASDFPELRKVIYKHDIGCTFDPNDPHDIARAVTYVFEDAERWQRMKQNTIAASQCYNWENESEKLINLYKALI